MSNKTLLVLAAGLGSRFGGLKQINGFGPNSETILEYSVYDAIQAGINKAVFVIRKDFEQEFREKITSKCEDRIEVTLVHQDLKDLPEGFSIPAEREKPWGTGHAVWVARHAIKSPFVVVNADDFYGRESFAIMSDHLGQLNPDDNSRHILLGFRLDKTLSENGAVSRGICKLDEKNNLLEIREYTKIYTSNRRIFAHFNDQEINLRGDEVVSMNMLGFSPAVFPFFKKYFSDFLGNCNSETSSEFFLPDVPNNLIKQHESAIKVVMSPNDWFGVSYKEDKAHVVRAIQVLIEQGKYPFQLWS